jgi:hypothetical protein
MDQLLIVAPILVHFPFAAAGLSAALEVRRACVLNTI